MAGGIGLSLLAGATGSRDTNEAEGLSRALSAARAATGAALQESRTSAIVKAADRVGPSVVSVNVVGTRIVRERSPFDDPFFRGLFPPRERLRQVESLGSGFIVSEDGYIVTNQHVVRGATEIVVNLIDGRQFTAELVAADPATDLAVLKVDAEGLPVAPLGNSDDLLIGEWAIAIGNPFGYLLADRSPSVTVGVISAIGRDVRPEPGDDDPQVWSNMIQTDAAINPGNSGGPLVNASGEVIGVNAFIFSESGGSIGLGFAIPINRARRALNDILAFGTIRRPWTGLHLGLVEREEAPAVRVAGVDPGSPAVRAGIRPGDIIAATEDVPLPSTIEWEGRLLDLPSGESIQLRIIRDGSELEVALTPEQDPLAEAERIDSPLGARLVVLDATLASYLELRSSRGLYLDELAAGSPLRRLGIREGDVLIAIGDEALDTPADAELLARALGSARPLALFVERSGVITRILVR